MASLAFDTDGLRQRLGAWVAVQLSAERPNIELLWRESALACDGIVALARAKLGTGDVPLWLVDVTVSADGRELVSWTGLPSRSLQQTVEMLVAAEVLDGERQVGRERVVRMRPDLLVDAPVLASLDWDAIRTQLGDADGPIARLLVRELARRTTPEARLQGHFISISQREFADSVGYSKASMRRHLDVLATTGVIVSRSRDRANSWHRLQTVAFGERDTRVGRRPPSEGARTLAIVPAHDDANAPDRDHAVARTRSRRERGGVQRSRDAVDSAPELTVADLSLETSRRSTTAVTPTVPALSVRPVGAALTVEVNGVRVALPPGVDLTLEQDASGALWYRAGALRLGPIRFT